jgi:hypothetical protein
MCRRLAKVITLIFSICLISNTSHSATSNNNVMSELLTRTINCERDSCKFVLTIILESFDLVKSYNDFNIVDGIRVYGIDGPPPYDYDSYMITRIKTMSLEINHQSILIDKSMYSCFLDPNIGEQYFAAYFSEDNRSVFVLLSGSGGAGAYNVIWCFSADGKCVMMHPTYDQLNFEMQESCN